MFRQISRLDKSQIYIDSILMGSPGLLLIVLDHLGLRDFLCLLSVCNTFRKHVQRYNKFTDFLVKHCQTKAMKELKAIQPLMNRANNFFWDKFVYEPFPVISSRATLSEIMREIDSNHIQIEKLHRFLNARYHHESSAFCFPTHKKNEYKIARKLLNDIFQQTHKAKKNHREMIKRINFNKL